MLEYIDYKPKCLEYIKDDMICFKSSYSVNSKASQVYMYIGIQIFNEKCSLHIDVSRWNHKAYREILYDWECLKKYLIKQGIKKAIASFAEIESKNWPKFIKLFGFPEPNQILISEQEL
jgi:hypothetical protein